MISLKEMAALPALEEKLVVSAGQGEFAAFEELIGFYKQPLWRFVFRLLNNAEDANDVVQQILIQIYYSLAQLENPARFRSWLFMIARNKCIDHLRRKSNISFSEFSGVRPAAPGRAEEEENESLSPLQLFPDPSPLPEEIFERGETVRLLQEAIGALPERSRQVVLLRYSTDLSFGEIGEVLNINENTVKTLFQRAKGQLRTYLKHRL